MTDPEQTYNDHLGDGIPGGDAAVLALAEAVNNVALAIRAAGSADVHPYPALEAVAVSLKEVAEAVSGVGGEIAASIESAS